MPSFFSAFTSEVFRPLATLLIPGAIGMSTWLIAMLWHFVSLRQLASNNHAETSLVIFLAMTFAGLVLEDVGSHFEVWLDHRADEKHSGEHTLCWNHARRRGKNHPYYRSLTGFLDAAGLDGPILWTELVKCESKQGTVLSIETIRKDINCYLFRELEKIPDDWPLIGVGRQAYEILAYRFFKRQVIGIPHPTASHGQFAALFPGSKAIERNAKEKLADLLRSKDTVAVWFSCGKGKGCRAE